ncbi:hypothetical protein QQG55_15030 [Brugia pahangi]
MNDSGKINSQWTERKDLFKYGSKFKKRSESVKSGRDTVTLSLQTFVSLNAERTREEEKERRNGRLPATTSS